MKKLLNKILNIRSDDDLYKVIQTIGNEYEQLLNGSYKKRNGIYYTSTPLAEYMIDELFKSIEIERLPHYKFLEPCVGVGNFVFAYLSKIKSLSISKEDYLGIIKNIYVADIDRNAIEIFKQMVVKISKIWFDVDILPQDLDNQIDADGLLLSLNSEEVTYRDIKNSFPEVMANGGFNIIVTNPPYKNLKAEKNKYDDFESYKKDKEVFEKISSFAKSHFKYVNKGVLNIYKLFVEEIITKYSGKDALISLLIPSSILTDRTCKQIRKYILFNHNIKNINVIEENAGYVNAQQGLSSLLVKKNQNQENILINSNFSESSKGNYSIIKKETVLDETSDYAIYLLKSEGYSILERLKQHPKLGTLDFIHNLRGELDLTLDKKFIVNTDTGLKLIRGRDISFYNSFELKSLEFVNRDFVKRSSKARFINQNRIACQQIANMKKDRRITFMLLEPNYVLANSCNFIAIENNSYHIDIYTVLGIMNSTLVNWLFKLTSSNNHINNYELDLLPFPLNATNLKRISDLTKVYLSTKNTEILTEIDQEVNLAFAINIDKSTKKNQDTNMSLQSKFVNDLNRLDNSIQFNELDARKLLENEASLDSIYTKYSLNQNNFLKRVIEGLVQKYRNLITNQVLNHETAKLSDLDMEMIKNVPQGGNWKNIPKEVVSKSKRLQRITETGGRTTLYGRIDYSKPAYTVTTYFNRPGNGTYVHPIHDRVISSREAARLQSFPDDYYFYGSKADLLKQIGNAVPPMLAYQIGRKLYENKIINNAIDLFAGAGGLTIGLKKAGINSIASIDNFERSCVTLKINNPEIHAISGDIKSESVKAELYGLVKNKEVDLICGGPPCQGFSYAGKRFIDDPRNSLFREFVEIVSVIKPKVFILENVPGMLTLAKGAIYKEIIELFSNLEYEIEGRLLIASEYGVPQKRKRLIVIGVRKGLDLKPSNLFPKSNISALTSANDAISDLEKIPCGVQASYLINTKQSKYVEALSDKITVQDYLNYLENKDNSLDTTDDSMKRQNIQLSLLG